MIHRLRTIVLLGATFALVNAPSLFAMATRPNADPNAPPPPAWVNLFPIFMTILVIYLFLIRPQSRQRRERDTLMNALKKGDRVLTQSGFVVTVVNLGATWVDVKLNDETRAKMQRSAIVQILPDGAVEKEAEPVVTGKS